MSMHVRGESPGAGMADADGKLYRILQLGKDQIYRDKADAFAVTIGRHPGIVTGRLKHDAIGEWRWQRAAGGCGWVLGGVD